MPGFDRNGPRGMGPMTGRGLGLCGGYAQGNVPAWPRYGYGRGIGRGRGGRGRGWGWRGDFYPSAANYGPVAPYPANQGISPEDETNMLKQQAEYMKQSLDAINKRLAEIEKKK